MNPNTKLAQTLPQPSDYLVNDFYKMLMMNDKSSTNTAVAFVNLLYLMLFAGENHISKRK